LAQVLLQQQAARERLNAAAECGGSGPLDEIAVGDNPYDPPLIVNHYDSSLGVTDQQIQISAREALILTVETLIIITSPTRQYIHSTDHPDQLPLSVNHPQSPINFIQQQYRGTVLQLRIVPDVSGEIHGHQLHSYVLPSAGVLLII
jgi:hypothetical protein